MSSSLLIDKQEKVATENGIIRKIAARIHVPQDQERHKDAAGCSGFSSSSSALVPRNAQSSETYHLGKYDVCRRLGRSLDSAVALHHRACLLPMIMIHPHDQFSETLPFEVCLAVHVDDASLHVVAERREEVQKACQAIHALAQAFQEGAC